MNKAKIKLIYIILILLFVSCQKKSNNSSHKSTKGFSIDSINTIDSIDFSHEKVRSLTMMQEINEKLKEYCQNSTYPLLLDTIVEENYVQYKFKFDYPNKYLFNDFFSIYVFNNNSEAILFFQDLYTQAYLKDFGINKRSNYIVRSDSIVFWKIVDSPRNHLFDLIKNDFKAIIEPCINLKNSDSLVGVEYGCCFCSKKTLIILKDYSEIYGKWKTSHYTSIVDSTNQRYSYQESKKVIEKNNGLEISINKDSISFGNDCRKIENVYSFEFPNSKFFFKYFLNPRWENEDKCEKMIELQNKSEKVIVFLIEFENISSPNSNNRVLYIKMESETNLMKLAGNELFLLEKIQ